MNIIRITYNLINLKGVFKVELLSRKGVKNHYAHQISYTIPYNLKELETLLLNLKYPLFKDLDDSLFHLCSIPEEFKILNNLKNILNPEEEEIIGNTLHGFNKTNYCRIRKN